MEKQQLIKCKVDTCKHYNENELCNLTEIIVKYNHDEQPTDCTETCCASFDYIEHEQ